jgi:pimeloyl-ACP methyl ester carboxylesterase
MRKVAAAVVVVFAVVGVSPAFGAHKPVHKPSAKVRKGPPSPAFYTPPAKIPGKRHGDLIWARAVSAKTALPHAAVDQNVLYRSTSFNGKTIAESGSVAIPKGKAPKGGWPIVTWAHGTTGIADQCAPSRTGPGVASPLEDSLLAAGYAVANTDYEGLGTPGTHPYLIGVSEGRSVLDIVRAAQQLYAGQISDNVAISGHSQGGQSAMWAAHLAPTWTPELKVKGTVPFAPVSHLEDQTGLLTSVNLTGLSGLVAMIIRGIDVYDPAANVSALLSPQAAALYPQTLTKCLSDLDKPDSFGALPLDQMVLPGADLSKVIADQKANDEALISYKTPLLIEQGLADTTVFPTYTQMMQTELTAAGVNSTLHTWDGITHGTVVTGAPEADGIAFIEKVLPPPARR